MITHTKDGQVKHSADCKRVFSRYDASCPRCQELQAGSKPRAGWQQSYYGFKAQQEDMQRKAIEQHFAPGGPHSRGECGPVCTFGEW